MLVAQRKAVVHARNARKLIQARACAFVERGCTDKPHACKISSLLSHPPPTRIRCRQRVASSSFSWLGVAENFLNMSLVLSLTELGLERVLRLMQM